MNLDIIKDYIFEEIDKLEIHEKQIELLNLSKKKKTIHTYMYFPAIYAEAFVYSNVETIMRLCFSSYLYYLSVIFLDKVTDNQIKDRHSINNHILLSQALQSYAIQSLQNIFTRDSKFWSFFNLRNNEWVNSVYTETDKDFDFTISNYSKHVISKVCIGKLSVDAIYVLEGKKNTELYNRLIDLYEMFYISYQILDDINDFDEDFDSRQINIAKDKAFKLINSQNLEITSKKEVKATFYLYLFEEIIHYAIQNIEVCITNLKKENLTFILVRAKKLLNDLHSKKEIYIEFINENKIDKPLVNIDDSLIDKRLHPSLTYLIANWETGFYKLKHKMYFSPRLGFTSKPLQIGDVFQRAIITTHFKTIIQNTKVDELTKIIEYEREYLKNIKKLEAGWKYFPELLELPCDSDDLAQIIQVFSNEPKNELEVLFKTPILELLKCSNEILFRTWIYSNSNYKIEKQHTEDKWGDTYDIDVISNIGHALITNLSNLDFLNEDQVLKILNQNALFVAKSQNKKGYWESVWYNDIYYGTYVSVRFLNKFKDYGNSIDNALIFLIENQNENGSWGDLNQKNLLNTALVILTLFETKRDRLYDNAITKASEFILSNTNADGSYSSDNFIKMEVGRLKKAPSKIIYYKSDVLCTSYCLTALSYVYREKH